MRNLWNKILRSAVVPYGILIALATSTMSYFVGTGVGLNNVLSNPDVIAGICAGLAAEALLYLMTLNAHAAFAAMIRLAKNDPRRDVLRRQFMIFLCLLIVLALFSGYNQAAFLWGHWTPVADFIVPGAVQMMIRAAISPAMMVLAAFLIPAQQNLAQLLNEAHGRDLKSLLRAHRKDMNRRIKAIRKAKGDLAPIVVAYSADMGENEIARRTRLLAEGLREAEQSAGLGGHYIATGAGETEYVDEEYHRAPVAIDRFRRAERSADEEIEDAQVTVRRILSANPRMNRQDVMKAGKLSMQAVNKWYPVVASELGIKQKRRTVHKAKNKVRKTA